MVKSEAIQNFFVSRSGRFLKCLTCGRYPREDPDASGFFKKSLLDSSDEEDETHELNTFHVGTLQVDNDLDPSPAVMKSISPVVSDHEPSSDEGESLLSTAISQPVPASVPVSEEASAKILDALDGEAGSTAGDAVDEISMEEGKDSALNESIEELGLMEEEGVLSGTLSSIANDSSAFVLDESTLDSEEEEDEIIEHEANRSRFSKVCHFLTIPFHYAFKYTIPDPNNKRWKYLFMLSFFCCLVWLAFLTYVITQLTTKLGCLMGVSDEIMGITFLALGTSLPDCLASIYVARTGKGGMAVSNALGSNIFDILFALTLPWLLSTLFGKEVKVQGTDFEIFTGCLFIALVALFAGLSITKWKLHKKLGAFLVVLYLVFIAFSILHAINTIPL